MKLMPEVAFLVKPQGFIETSTTLSPRFVGPMPRLLASCVTEMNMEHKMANIRSLGMFQCPIICYIFSFNLGQRFWDGLFLAQLRSVQALRQRGQGLYGSMWHARDIDSCMIHSTVTILAFYGK